MGRAGIRPRSPDPYEVVAYRGYAHATRVLIQGRAQECENIPHSTATDSSWRSLLSTYKRIESDPLAHARVIARIAGVERTLVADDEGFLREWIELPSPLPTDKPWQPFELELVEPCDPIKVRENDGARARARAVRRTRRHQRPR
jgi:hypothetical protein